MPVWKSRQKLYDLNSRNFTIRKKFVTDIPSYQLAVTVDDAAMRITEVVRGADLLLSTARQILIYRALRLAIPKFYHCPLVTDEKGVRLAKRHDALSLQALRRQKNSPEKLWEGWL